MTYKKIFLSILLLFTTLSISKAQANPETTNKESLQKIEAIISNLSDQELEILAEYVENNPHLLQEKINIELPSGNVVLLTGVAGLLICYVSGWLMFASHLLYVIVRDRNDQNGLDPSDYTEV